MYNNFGKIGVICGGLSSERDISLKSGQAVYGALLKEGLDVEEIDLISEDTKEVEDVIRKADIDIAFIAMHGRFGEDGKLQAILESMSIAYVGSDSLASAFAMDKIVSKRLFKEHNIPTPHYKILNINKKGDIKKNELNFPLVIKPQSQGSSVGVSIIEQPNQIQQAMDSAFGYDDNIIIEEYIKGKEITVGILDSRALEPIEILSKNKFFDFQAKYNKGLTEYILPCPIGPDLKNKIQQLSLKAHRVLGCRHLSRVDLILDEKDNPFVLEVNTIPGFTSTSLLPKAALYEGITFSQLCLKLITMAVKGIVASLKK